MSCMACPLCRSASVGHLNVMDAGVVHVGEEGGTVGLLPNEGGRKQVVSHQLYSLPVPGSRVCHESRCSGGCKLWPVQNVSSR